MDDPDLDTLLARLAATPRRRPPVELIGLTRFELLRPLGGGGFGDVFEARDREHGTLVALKALRSSHPDWVYRFKREFRVVSDLTHPNLVRLHELFCEHDQWYLTMELIEGLRFDQHLARAPEQLRGCFAQLALGIDALHRASCLHRDLKASNALVESSGRVVVVDFGLAVATRGPLHTAVAGTPPFMAPELARGDEPTPASDWYAFGVMLYEALAGRLPFDGTDTQMDAGKRAGPARLPAGVAPELAALVYALLAPEPGARPLGDEILTALASTATPLPSRRDDGAGFGGRRRELAVLDDAAARSRDRAVVVTLDGHPGMGKTSVVAAFAEAARRAGGRVYEGRCHEAESVPYKGLDGVIDALCADLGRLPAAEVEALLPAEVGALAQMFPVLKRIEAFARLRRNQRAASPHEARRAGAAGLRELLTRLARRGPVTLFVDDLQWASDDGVRLLLDLLKAPPPALLTIVAYRRDAIGRSPALDLFRNGLAARPYLAHVDLPIEPLDADGVAQLLAAQPGTAPSLDAIMRETAGHPYLLARLLEGDDDAATGAADLAAILSSQLAQLEPAARALLEVVSIAGAPLRPRAAFAAAQLVRDPAIVDQLRRRKLIHRLAPTPEAELEAFHDRIREVVVAAMPAAHQVELHRRVAAALEAGGVGEPERLAHHHRAAGDVPRALEWTRRAARKATEELAFARAAELYQRAAGLDLDDRQRLEVLDELAEAQVRCGRRSDAGQTCLDAIEVARRLGDADADADDVRRARAGEHFLLGGHLERGLVLLGDALAEVGVTMPTSAAVAVAESFNLGGALAARGLALRPAAAAPIAASLRRRRDLEVAVSRALSLTDVRAPLMATRAVIDALDAGEPADAQRALSLFVINNSARAPDHPLVVEAEDRAEALAEALRGELARAWADLARGFRAAQRDAYVTALEALRDAERRFAAAGPSHAREAAIARLLIAIVCGNGVDLPYARRHHAGCLDEALARGDLFAATWARMTHAWLQLVADAPGAAREDLQAARQTWPRAADSLFAANALLNEIAIDLYEAPATAWHTVERLEPEFRQLFSSLIPYPRAFFCRIAGNSAMAAYHAGRADRARTAARLTALADEAKRLPYAVAGHLVIDAHLHVVAGDRPRAIASLEDAARHWSGVHQRAQALTARLRIHQLGGDTAGAAAMTAALGELTVVEPDRYALLFAGPRPA